MKVEVIEVELVDPPTPKEVYIFKATEAKNTGVNMTFAVVSARWSIYLLEEVFANINPAI